MIGTIRKHSTWLWGIIIAATVVTFVFWGTNPGGRGNGHGPGNYGSIAGRKITDTAYRDAQAEVFLDYFLNSGEWPDKNPNVTAKDLRGQVYVRLMLIQKARDLGITVSDNEVAKVANQILRSLGRNGESVPLESFDRQVLQPKGLSLADFQGFVRHHIMIEELRQTVGLPGELLTPQEAVMVYEREHRELSTQIAFFSASNHLVAITTTPAQVRQYYTNYLAQYRRPDRVQVSYVEFNVSNYLAVAEAKLAKTNLNEQVDAIYNQYGLKGVPGAKTPAEARTKIRQELIRAQAITEARKAATAFANVLFSREPVRPQNLVAVAKAEGVVAHVTAPFAKDYGPKELGPVEAFTRAAFNLTTNEPFAGPVVTPHALYVIALLKQLPSEIPPFNSIRDQVTADCRHDQAVHVARRQGTNFEAAAAAGLATGKSFTSLCTTAGVRPVLLPPFSLSTAEVPELDDHATLNQLKEAAFSTPVGQASRFTATSDGGFVIYVQSRLPIDQQAMNADLQQFTARLRFQRQREVFNNWLQHEANQDLRDTPLYQDRMTAAPQGNAGSPNAE